MSKPGALPPPRSHYPSSHLSLHYGAPQVWYAQAGLAGSNKVYLDADQRHDAVDYQGGYVTVYSPPARWARA